MKFLKKLRTASLNSEFTGSYKKKYAKRFSVDNTEVNILGLTAVYSKS